MELLKKIEEKYLKDKNLKDSWEYEYKILEIAIPKLIEEVSFNYTAEDVAGIGGSGIVLKVMDQNLNQPRALKISRPSPGKEKLLADVLISETNLLVRFTHQNLVKVFAKGKIEGDDYYLPYYIMEYLNADNSDLYFIENELTEDKFLNILYTTIEVIEYLHNAEIIHMDIKPSNIMITKFGEPILVDLGFAKIISKDSKVTIIGGTEGFIHPEAIKFMTEIHTDPNRFRGKAKHEVLKKEWDLYSLGKTFLKMINIISLNKPKLISIYTKRYLLLLSCRLLDGFNSENEKALGLPISTYKEIKYKTISEVKEDFEKLIGSYNIEQKIPELNFFSQDTIQVSVIATTPFTKRVKDILNHPYVMRLGNITQLGLLNLLYPSASHTRLEHSLGTFSILIRFVLALYNDPLNPLFKQIMNEEDIRAILLASLLHDIGQYPLAHDLEEADHNIFSHKKFGKLLLYEENSLIKLISDVNGWNLNIGRVTDILDADMENSSIKDRIMHTLIDGPIDADKIDYLIRDSRHLGLNYANVIDLERLLRCLTVVLKIELEKTYAALGLHEKGKIPAESIAFARYAMFGAVYWHHAYRSIKAMLHRIVWEVLDTTEDHKELKKDFYELIKPQESTSSQIELFDEESSAVSTQIIKTDLKTLIWLASRSNKTGIDLYNLLLKRNLYKRIFVLTREKTVDKNLWDDYNEFFKSQRKDWKLKLRLNRIFQNQIIEFINNPDIEIPVSKVLTPTNKNKFLADSIDKAILLIDFPPDWKHREYPLEYVAEENRRFIKIDQFKVGSLEESEIWKVLRDSTSKSIGKLRVYCHPDHSEYLSAMLSHDTIQKFLKSAIRNVEHEQ